MTNLKYGKGHRVAAIYMNEGGGTSLDYSGVVESTRVSKSGAGYLTVRYAGGAVRETLAHPDYVFSMEAAFRYAARFLELAPDAEATPESFEAVLVDCFPRPPRGLMTMRGIWAVGHLRKIAG